MSSHNLSAADQEALRQALTTAGLPEDFDLTAAAILVEDLRVAGAIYNVQASLKIRLGPGDWISHPPGTLDLAGRVALANAVAERRRDLEQNALLQEVGEEDTPPSGLPGSMRKKKRKMLRVIYELTEGKTGVLIERDESLFEAMQNVGLDLSEADLILERMESAGWITGKYFGKSFELTPEGAEEVEGGGAAWAASP